MKLILSRKGFDSSAGGCPSPVFPDSSFYTLPIPDPRSRIAYKDINHQGINVGKLVSGLTGNRRGGTRKAHLDPDLIADVYSRETGWRPCLGQTGAAQGHLRKQQVGVGDLFLFFGLFRDVEKQGTSWQFVRHARPFHGIWGWLQVGEVHRIDDLAEDELPWARYHPHAGFALPDGPWRRHKNAMATAGVFLPGVGRDGIEFSQQPRPLVESWGGLLSAQCIAGAGICVGHYKVSGGSCLVEGDSMKVMLLGATGLTGGKVLEGLLASNEVSSVVTPVRRSLALSHDKLEQHEIDFDRLDQHAGLFAVDAIICCLGTTISKAGSRDQFRRVDFAYPLKAAELGRANGAKVFMLMSAIAASSSSTVFYNRVKGELEDAVKALGYPCLSIYQPSLLLGEREEHRTAEALGMKAMPLINRVLIGPLERFRGIEVATLARAMVNEVCSPVQQAQAEPVVRIHEYPEIVALAGDRA